jgi:hypothetical protein
MADMLTRDATTANRSLQVVAAVGRPSSLRSGGRPQLNDTDVAQTMTVDDPIGDTVVECGSDQALSSGTG